MGETDDTSLHEGDAVMMGTFAVNSTVDEGSTMDLPTLSMEVLTSSSVGSYLPRCRRGGLYSSLPSGMM